MNETKIFADAYQTTFADPKEMLEFLAQRAKESSWIRKPTRTLRLVPAIQEAGKMKDTVGKNWEEILEDTENNTQLALKIKGETYPVRTCAIRTILDRAGISGSGLRKLNSKLCEGSELLPEGSERGCSDQDCRWKSICSSRWRSS